MDYPIDCVRCGYVNTYEFKRDGVIVCTNCHKPLPIENRDTRDSPAVITNKGGKRIIRSN